MFPIWVNCLALFIPTWKEVDKRSEAIRKCGAEIVKLRKHVENVERERSHLHAQLKALHRATAGAEMVSGLRHPLARVGVPQRKRPSHLAYPSASSTVFGCFPGSPAQSFTRSFQLCRCREHFPFVLVRAILGCRALKIYAGQALFTRQNPTKPPWLEPAKKKCYVFRA